MEQSKIRSLLIQAEIALKQDRFEEAIAMLNGINLDEMSLLSFEELQAIGRLLNYLNILASEKKEQLSDQLKTIQASKQYIG